PAMGKEFLGDDPLIDFSLKNLKKDLNRSLDSFQSGHLEYSRNTLKTAIGHCFRCHSVAKEGSQAPWLLGENLNQLQLAPVEKIDLFVAGRKYSEAIEYAQKLVKDPLLMQEKPLEYDELL